MFLSYAHADRERVFALRDALEAEGLRAWFDERRIETFESITGAIERGLSRSRALLAFYSMAYPARRACQWELTAAFLAGQRAGDPRHRVLVVNPEVGADHIEPIELRDALFAAAPAANDRDAHVVLARSVRARLAGVKGVFGDLEAGHQPRWVGRRPVGAARFVGRTREMWALHSTLTARDIGLITGAHNGDPAVKLTGMGGIGKSMLAQEYALRFAAAYPGGIFWLRAHGHDQAGETLTPEAREAERDTQLLAFAGRIGIETTGLTPGQVPGTLERFLDGQAQTFLWVVDDLLAGLASDALEEWLAPGRYGRTLVTTRSRTYRAIGAQVDLGALTPQEGLELLTKHRLAAGESEWAAARGLVKDLGRHALALDVAGAALHAEQGVRSIAAYRAALANLAANELELAADLVGELPGGHEANVAVTLARSVDRLNDSARDFLRLASRLAVDAIPPNLVIAVFAQVDHLDENTARHRAVAAMNAAAAASLAEITESGGRQVHALVSRVIQRFDRKPERASELATAAAGILARYLAAAGGDRVAADSLTLAHARQVAAPLLDVGHLWLLSWVAVHDTYRGDYRTAGRLQEQALDGYRRLVGDEHPDTLGSLNNLAATRQAQGDYASARALHEQALTLRRRTLGDEHPDTLDSINNLADTLHSQGDYAGARALFEQALAVLRRTLGEEDPATLDLTNNLAETLRAQGDYASARALHEQALALRRRTLGDEHRLTLLSLNNLAATLHALGDYASARGFLERALAVYTRVLGDEHPDTLQSLNNLAWALYSQGDHVGSRALFEQAVASRQRTLGDQHPATLDSINNLAATLYAQGDYAGARALLEPALAALQRTLGDEHPATQRSLNGLAATLRAQAIAETTTPSTKQPAPPPTDRHRRE